MFQTSLMRVLKEKLDGKTKLLPVLMKRSFDQQFRCAAPTSCMPPMPRRYDENRLPRTWAPDVDIQALYIMARVHALQVLELFADPADELTIDGRPIFSLPRDQLDALRDQLDDAITLVYQEALAAQKSQVKCGAWRGGRG